jgi:transmembrane sensor
MDELAQRLTSLRERVTTPWDEARSELAFEAVARLRRRRRMRNVGLSSGAVVVAAVGVVFLRLPAPAGSEQAHAPTQPSAPAAAPAPDVQTPSVAPSDSAIANIARPTKRLIAGQRARLSDGSQVRVKSADGELFIDGDRPDDVALRLATGSAQFDVVPNTQRRFIVAAGEVEVVVVGTAFEVERVQERVRVSVSHGKVRVRGGAAETFVEGGESRWFGPSGAPSSTTAPASESARWSGRGAKSTSSSPTRPARTALREEAPLPEPPPPDWRSLNERGDYARAYELLASGALVEDDAEALMDAADVARLSNHAEVATKYLNRVLRDHRGEPSTPLAAFTLGLVLLDRLARPDEAAKAFAEARALAPHASLAQDALAREVEAWSKAGHAQEAYQRARLFVQTYPESRRVAAVQIYGGLRAP